MKNSLNNKDVMNINIKENSPKTMNGLIEMGSEIEYKNLSASSNDVIKKTLLNGYFKFAKKTHGTEINGVI